MELSIVTTLYKSDSYIEKFYKQACDVAQKIVKEFEIIMVNDGSPGRDLDIALNLHKKDPRVKIIDLSRNFGHHRALMTGISFASGNLVYITDSDIEEPLTFLEECYQELTQQECDVVYGYQISRKGRFFERITGEFFWKFINRLLEFEIPQNLVTARLMTRRYVNNLLKFRERDPFLAGLWTITGFEQRGLPINKACNQTTSYSLGKKISQAVTSVTSFSSKPLLLVSLTGFLICIVSTVFASYIILRWLLYDNPVQGWTSSFVSIWFLGGINIFFVGIIGVYVSKVFTETKKRPYIIIRQIHGEIPKQENDLLI